MTYTCGNCNNPVEKSRTNCSKCWTKILWDENELNDTNIKEKWNDQVNCPQCGSTNIYIGKKGYNSNSWCCGYILCGPLWFLLWQSNANKIIKTCVNCNHSW